MSRSKMTFDQKHAELRSQVRETLQQYDQAMLVLPYKAWLVSKAPTAGHLVNYSAHTPKVVGVNLLIKTLPSSQSAKLGPYWKTAKFVSRLGSKIEVLDDGRAGDGVTRCRTVLVNGKNKFWLQGESPCNLYKTSSALVPPHIQCDSEHDAILHLVNHF